MSICNRKQFWLERLPVLFCSIDIIPRWNDTLEEQMNTITRLILFIWFILILFNYNNNILFALISIVFIIIMYYIKRKPMKENYNDAYKTKSIPKYCNVKGYNSKMFCNDGKVVNIKDKKPSISQKLVGPANPKTLEIPIIAARSHDMDFWRENNLTNHSGINSSNPIDDYRSGYRTKLRQRKPQIRENYSCGHNIGDNGMAVNMNAPPCMNDKESNSEYFTSTIQPGVYTYSSVNEPINTNIGISQTPNLPYLKKQVVGDNTFYERTNEPVEYKGGDFSDEVTEWNVYDPRFNGYGTQERTYFEPFIGQPRFFYDDVEAARQENYITRNKVDTQKWVSQYEMNDNYSGDFRKRAHNNFLADQLSFRNDLQEKMMRKNNAVNWQRKMYPITTNKV